MRASAADELDAPSQLPIPDAGSRLPDARPQESGSPESGSPPRGICPYLEVSAARWRHASPSRDHRCRAIASGPPLTTDKQRRLCLGPAHVTCASYLGALDARRTWAFGPAAAGDEAVGDAQEPAALVVRPPRIDANRWGLSRTAPVVAAGSPGSRPLDLVRHRAAAQVGLGGLLVVAFVAIAVSRGPGDGSSGALLAPTATPTVTPTLAPTLAPTASPTAIPTPVPTPTLAPTPTVAPTPAATTYRVVSGDTLSGIAGRFGTTVKAIMDLNGLTSTTLRNGQQLLIPVKPVASPAPSA
jgi:hypothetical protein